MNLPSLEQFIACASETPYEGVIGLVGESRMSLFLFVGSSNRSKEAIQQNAGIAVFRFDEDTLTADPVLTETGIDNPSYLNLDRHTGTLLAVSEVEAWSECTLSAYRFDPEAGKLTYLNKQPTRGSSTCHVSFLPGRRAGIANYGSGEHGPDQAICLYSMGEDGHLGAPETSFRHEGPTGPVKERQDRNHAHCLVPTPDGRFLLAVDLGLDCIIGYSGTPPHEAFRAQTTAGFGPRHLVCHPDAGFVYVLNELKPFVSVFRLAEDGLIHLEDVAALSDPKAEPAWGAGIQTSRDGRFLYASIRGQDCVSVFQIEEEGRTLSLTQSIATGGRWPRDFTLTPSGRHLLVANQHSDTITIFARDAVSGHLTMIGTPLGVPAPQCVKAVEFS